MDREARREDGRYNVAAMRRLRPALYLLFATLLAVPANGISEIEHLIIVAGKAPTLEQNLRALTDEVGGRVPGTPAMERAVAWAVAAFREAGADSVTTEEFEMPASWQEGETRVRVTAPAEFRVRAVSIAWSPAIAQPLRARVVDVGSGTAAEFDKAGDLAGAIVLVRSKLLKTWADLFEEYMVARPILAQARQHGAAAVAWTATREHNLLYRHINDFVTGRPGELPEVLLAREDSLRIQRLLAAGQKVEMEVVMPNRAGPAFRTANVVAEIRGRAKPEEYVVVGAHLDSWDLGTGALDDGANCALVIEALRAIKASGLRPLRSIKFVLFSGEEQGLHGSRAFVRRYRAELDNVAANLIFDEGTGRVTGFSLGGRRDLDARVRAMMAPLARYGVAKNTTDAFVGTDNLDFLLEGVPNLVANQVEANYLENYHASSDTFDKVDMAQLRKHVVIAAVMAFQLANTPERVGKRQSRAEVERLLVETKLDEQMKLFGLWEQWESGARGRER